MAKYDSNLTELKNLLPNAKNILIALPAGAEIDKFAAGLALFLAFEQQNKEISIVSDDTVKVSQAHLFGVDHIQKNLPQTGGGNFVLTLEGVASPDGTIPALEKLDWYPEGSNLNLVFHVTAGQSFQPAKVVPRFQGSGLDLIFTIGAASLNSLGTIYGLNSQAFSGIHIVNIDNQSNNTSFGSTNVVDTTASSVSEIMADLISSLGLPYGADEASNLLAGIFEATSNLTGQNLTADTFLAVANCLRVGGKKPELAQATPVQPVVPVQSEQPKPAGFDLSALIPPGGGDFTVPPVVNSTPSDSQNTPSAEERPQMEGISSAEAEVEPGWLTPKVFKGSSAG